MSTSTSLFERLGPEILAGMFEVAAHGLALVERGGRLLHVNAVGCAILAREYADLLGSTWLDSLALDSRREGGAWFEAGFGGLPEKRDLVVRRPDGSERVASFFGVPVSLQGETVALVAFHDVTVARRAEREAAALRAIAAGLAQETSVNGASRRLADEVVRITPAGASAVILLSRAPLRGRVAGASGLSGGFVQALEASLLVEPNALAERMPGAGEVRVIDGLQALYRSDATREVFDAVLTDVHWDRLVCLPLIYLGERTGALFAYYLPDRLPSEADVAFLRSIAEQSVFAIENARLLAEVQDKAALEERQRLARELHDSVSQALYGIALGTRSARSQLGRNPERVAERLDYVMKMAEAAVSEMRALIFELRPETLEAEGLVMAVAKQAAAMRARHGLEVRTLLDEEPPLPFLEKQALYRIAQEALHNIVKHAHARRVELELGQLGGRVVLQVRDDGVGFDAAAPYPGHFGLRSMRERAEGLGGTFRLDSAPGRGATLRVELPLRRAAPATSD